VADERKEMRALGDFVNGSFAVPQNPIRDAMGMGAFLDGAFAVPQNPVGMGDCGCGCNGGCNGMGQLSTIDWSLDSTSIGAEFGLTSVPNWLLYAGVAGIAVLSFSSGKKGRRRK
jgi:hypothetical protein